ncbi:hypothetical protein DFJ58DRAFT_872310 [Suillus subalutaceus]|uniref:uncharacterized protein n=1 Tax=Suillus subalutaceus TaxID=48586 RepID=UPI001B881B8D|nr:uncharacterized protein DFJ58DRAFT_872310 [Suillus subalutaceus]KAG1861569.1 hypothetical protein DFJ58DRAFT_872310 [Suillus subalutaceus]
MSTRTSSCLELLSSGSHIRDMRNYSNLMLSPLKSLWRPDSTTLEHCHVKSRLKLITKVEIVPLKFYNIKVVQFWRGEKEHLWPYPLHWAICVEISPDIGNTYQLVGNQTNYPIDIRLNLRLQNSDDWRGSYSVGSVSSTELDEMETTLRRVDIIHDLLCWNSQDWVDDTLRYLKCWGFSDIIEEPELANLQDRMCWLLESWPGIQNAVEFVGDSIGRSGVRPIEPTLCGNAPILLEVASRVGTDSTVVASDSAS